MELLVPLASIHTIRIQPSKYATEFFQSPPERILFHIVQAVLETADPEYFSADIFFEFLNNNMDTEDIFINLYKSIGIDITQIWEIPSAECFSEEEAAIASSFFFMGILLDKWFLTPLGDFLQIIQPIYYLPFYFVSTLNRIANLIVAKFPLQAELYSPCSV